MCSIDVYLSFRRVSPQIDGIIEYVSRRGRRASLEDRIYTFKTYTFVVSTDPRGLQRERERERERDHRHIMSFPPISNTGHDTLILFRKWI